MKKKIALTILLLFLVSCQQCLIKRNSIVNHNFTEAIAYAKKNLPSHGVLRQNKDGYAYVKVNDSYINELFNIIKLDNSYKRPPYFRRKDSPGAHISVAYSDEKVRFKEVGSSYSFELREINIVEAKKNYYVVLNVFSPQLETLRKKYGLSRKLKDHEFHITIAKKSGHK